MQKEALDWLALPYAHRKEEIFSSQLSKNFFYTEQTTETEAKLFENIFHNYRCLIRTQNFKLIDDYKDSKKNFSLLIARIEYQKKPLTLLQHCFLLDQAHWLTTLLIHFGSPPCTKWEEISTAMNKFYYELLPLIWKNLTTEIKVEFFLTASNYFSQNNYYRESLTYLTQAYQLSSENQSSISEKIAFIEKVTVKQLKKEYYEALSLKISEELSTANILAKWKVQCSLLDALTEKGEYDLLAVLYEKLEPLLIQQYEFLDEFYAAKDNKAKITSIWNTLLETYIYHFSLHKRYALAELWCEKIEKWCTTFTEDKENLQELYDSSSHYRQTFQAQKKQPVVPQTVDFSATYFYQILAELRKKLQENINAHKSPLPLQTQFTADVRDLLRQIAVHITQQLSAPPCVFSVLGLGSLSRNDMSLASDVDIAFLIEDNQFRNHPYFTAWLRLWLFYLHSLGSVFLPWEASSLQDSGDFHNLDALLHEPYVQSPISLAMWAITTNPNESTRPVRALYHATEIYTSNDQANLFLLFTEKLTMLLTQQKTHQTLAENAFSTHVSEYLKEQHVFKYNQLENVSLSLLNQYVKKAYISPLVNICLDIKLYLNLATSPHLPTLFKNFKEKQVFTDDFNAMLYQVWEKLQEIRHQLYQTHLDINIKQLKEKLTLINKQVLKPWWKNWKIWLTHNKTTPFDPLSFPQVDGYRCSEGLATFLLDLHLDKFTTENSNRHCMVCSTNNISASFPPSISATLQLPGELMVRPLAPVVVYHLIEPNTGRLRERPLHISHDEQQIAHRHRVISVWLKEDQEIYALYFKENPDHPLMDYATYLLRQRLFGHGGTINRAAKLTVRSQHYRLSYPVLISIAVGNANDNLKYYLDNNKPLNLSFRHFFEATLFEAIAHPGDASPRNYQVKKLVEGKNLLVSVDGDQYFVKPTVDTFTGRKLQMRCIHFCFDEMQQIDTIILTQVFQAYLQLNVKLLLEKCLDAFTRYENSVGDLFSEEERVQYYKKMMTLHLLLPEGTIARLATDLCNLQAQMRWTLTSGEFPSALALIEHLHDLNAYRYKQVLNSSTTSPSQRFKTISNSALISKTSSQSLQASLGRIPSYQEIAAKKIFSAMEAKNELVSVAAIFIGKHTQIKQYLKATYFIADFEKNQLSAPKQKILFELSFYRKFTHVVISHSEVFDNTLLKALLVKMADSLVMLRLDDCEKINNESVNLVVKNSPKLKSLSLLNNKNLTVVKIVPFYLSLFDRVESELTIDYLNLSGNVNLHTVEIVSKTLITLKIKRCSELEKEYPVFVQDNSIKIIAPLLTNIQASENLRYKLQSKNEGIVKGMLRIIPDESPMIIIEGPPYLELPKIKPSYTRPDWTRLREMAIDSGTIVICTSYGFGEDDIIILTKIIAKFRARIFFNINGWNYHYFETKNILALVEAIESNDFLLIFHLDAYNKHIPYDYVERIKNKLNNNLENFLQHNASMCEMCNEILQRKITYKFTSPNYPHLDWGLGLPRGGGDNIWKIISHFYWHIKHPALREMAYTQILNFYKNKHKLIKLNLSFLNMDDSAINNIIEIINNNKSLIKINLANNKFTDNGIKQIFNTIKYNANIVNLCIAENDTTKSINNLIILYLFRNFVIINKINVIRLYDIVFTAEHATLLVEVLHKQPDISKFSLHDCKFELTTAKLIFIALKNCNKLKILVLVNCNSAFLPFIGDVLRNNSQLEELDFSHNKLSDSDVKKLFKVREFLGNLSILILSGCGITNNGLIVLASRLTNNQKIRKVDLSGGHFTQTKAIQMFGEAINIHCSLAKLTLSNCQIDDDNVKIFFSYLQNNYVLKTVELQDNKISVVCISILESLLKNNKSLLTFNLKNNPIVEATEELIKIFEKNFSLLEISCEFSQPRQKDYEQIKSRNLALKDQLHQAAKEGNLLEMQRLVAQGVSLLSCAQDGNTLLHVAVINTHVTVVEWLVTKMKARKIPLDNKNNAGQTALQIAYEKNNQQIIACLSAPKEVRPLRTTSNITSLLSFVAPRTNSPLYNSPNNTSQSSTQNTGIQTLNNNFKF